MDAKLSPARRLTNVPPRRSRRRLRGSYSPPTPAARAGRWQAWHALRGEGGEPVQAAGGAARAGTSGAARAACATRTVNDAIQRRLSARVLKPLAAVVNHAVAAQLRRGSEGVGGPGEAQALHPAGIRVTAARLRWIPATPSARVPTSRTNWALAAEQVPSTYRPRALASCTATDPTPPEAACTCSRPGQASRRHVTVGGGLGRQARPRPQAGRSGVPRIPTGPTRQPAARRPLTSTRWPGDRCEASSACQAVSETSGSAAASSSLMPAV